VRTYETIGGTGLGSQHSTTLPNFALNTDNPNIGFDVHTGWDN